MRWTLLAVLLAAISMLAPASQASVLGSAQNWADGVGQNLTNIYDNGNSSVRQAVVVEPRGQAQVRRRLHRRHHLARRYFRKHPLPDRPAPAVGGLRPLHHLWNLHSAHQQHPEQRQRGLLLCRLCLPVGPRNRHTRTVPRWFQNFAR
ncbi:exported hypothetical protein [Thiomonas delicata]|uniref:Uncharacterized protein n=1 Tax=Thiomonas delicata TaxID=364030 RepID=A0A238D3W4_THIDL|nr:exported hypothetical protein [Thiomonas delicata]